MYFMHFCNYTLIYLSQKWSKEFYKKGVLKNSTKFTGKHLPRGLFCSKDAGLRSATSLKTESGTEALL